MLCEDNGKRTIWRRLPAEGLKKSAKLNKTPVALFPTKGSFYLRKREGGFYP